MILEDHLVGLLVSGTGSTLLDSDADGTSCTLELLSDSGAPSEAGTASVTGPLLGACVPTVDGSIDVFDCLADMSGDNVRCSSDSNGGGVKWHLTCHWDFNSGLL